MNDARLSERSIFEAAFEKGSPEERATYLDQACGGDEGLRKGVEALLAAHDRLGHAPSNASAPLPAATAEQPAVTECPGTVIGPYKLLEQIGEGGFGIVFMAEQLQPVRRKVALKVIKPGMDTKQVIARFEAERQALALMDHPNIAKVLQAGATESGRPYFVMDLVKGLPITEYCDQNHFTARERLELFIPVCQAVQHAHQKGIIHRDIKPSNVLVTLRDGTPVVKVIDFGIAKATGQQLTEKTLFTNFAQIIGTPLYMSPEQAALSELDVDTRSDIYSLGVLLYELLTGTTPVGGEQLRQAAFDEIRRIIREDDPPKPSTRISTLGQASTAISARRKSDPKTLSQLCRRDLDWIVMKALDKDRTRRYETANAFAADIQRYLSDKPVEARPPSHRYLLGKFVRRHRAGMVISAVLVLAALLGAAGVYWAALERTARQAEAEAQRLETERLVAEDLKEAAFFEQKDQWPQVRQVLQRASDRLQAIPSGAIREQVGARQRDAALVLRLEEIRIKSADTFADEDPLGFAVRTMERRPHLGWADRAFATAFAEHGLDVSAVPAQEIADRIRASAVRAHLVTALDFWVYVKESLPKGDAARLLEIARLADDDPWRQELRDPRLAKDRARLERLSKDEKTLVQPPPNLLFLSLLLDRSNAWRASVRLLRIAQLKHPSDFWLAFELASHLARDPVSNVEAIGFYRVALALQPQSPVVYGKLVYMLVGNGMYFEAIETYRQAVALNVFYFSARYNAACAAALAGSGQGRPTLAEDSYERARLRKQALTWLRADLDGIRSKLQNDPKKVSFDVWRSLAHMQNDGDFRYVRGAEALAKLPAAERQEWREFWGEVAALRTAAKQRAIEIHIQTPDAAYAYRSIAWGSLESDLFAAVSSFRKAIELEPDVASFNPLGHTLYIQQRFPEAQAVYEKILELDPENASAFHQLGNVFYLQGKLTKAAEMSKTAIAFRRDYTSAYNSLGNIWRAQGKLSDADAAFAKANELNEAIAAANMGYLLMGKGLFSEAVASFERCRDLGQGFHEGERAKRWRELDEKLPKILKGVIQPGSAAERLELAYLCQLHCRQLFAASSRFYREAFAAEPELVGERRAGICYSAARAAALAGCGQGKDAAHLDSNEQSQLRGQALAWLQADLVGWQAEFEMNRDKARSGVLFETRQWLKDSSFVGVRGPTAFDKLPQAEREGWQQLWREVETLQRRAAGNP
jgi:serine/threonine protein kinase/Flp pilus assembly protein TadD